MACDDVLIILFVVVVAVNIIALMVLKRLQFKISWLANTGIFTVVLIENESTNIVIL